MKPISMDEIGDNFEKELRFVFGECTCSLKIYNDDNNSIKTRWENVFASSLSNKEKETIVFHNFGGYEGYYWHIFSKGKVACKEGEDALVSLAKELKKNCNIIIFFENFRTVVELSDYTISDIDAIDEFISVGYDMYIVDDEFSFTFVSTHEDGWFGPYYTDIELMKKETL